ncbi:hypothetical protein [Marinomonas transparens]|uniref:Lipoprotein n=1 Tax=Marinomonas transparens TaxID=2795388 RepID=A0A934JSD3_9GAMM|nr:hypothetical protein [Marinomonas transparens]MBJ7539129.1 hypothetical protein [Marinomonas transparens]
MTKKAVSIVFFALFMTGCQGNFQSVDPIQPEVTDETPAVAQEPETVDVDGSKPEVNSTSAEENAPDAKMKSSEPIVKKQLTSAQKITQRLIKQGDQALAAKRLLTPEDDNANLYFQAALGREPGNFEAIHGIASIVDLYTQWAWEAARSRSYSAAARYLELARFVNPEDALIVEVSSRIKDLRSQREQRRKKVTKKKQPKELKEGQYLLPKNLFSLSEDEIIAKIQPIIDEVIQTKDSLAIYWSNDKEARLIYQIINSRVEDFRVRGMIYHRADYMVELQQD